MPMSAAACSAGAGRRTAGRACSTPDEVEELAPQRPAAPAPGPGRARLRVGPDRDHRQTSQRYRGYWTRPTWPCAAVSRMWRCCCGPDRCRPRLVPDRWPPRSAGLGARRAPAGPGLAGDRRRRWQPGRAAQAALPAGTLPLERLQVIVPALAATDQFRLHLDRPAVVGGGRVPDRRHDRSAAAAAGQGPDGRVRTARGSAAPAASRGGRSPGGAVPGGAVPGGAGLQAPGAAARLAPKLCTGPVPAGLVRVLNAALVLLADHELAASTLAARVAASMRADPYAVVATGLGAMGGALHGGAALGAELMLGSAASPEDAPRVVGDLLRRGERLPGFGHFVYKDGDPRANLLLELDHRISRRTRRSSPSPQRSPTRPGAGLCPSPTSSSPWLCWRVSPSMIRGAGEAIFATGRTAGWLAHALEEYERNIPIRPRGVYTGPTAVALTSHAGVRRSTDGQRSGRDDRDTCHRHASARATAATWRRTEPWPSSSTRSVTSTGSSGVAADRSVTITHVLETHIHNDYVTGGLALARETGAEYLSTLPTRCPSTGRRSLTASWSGRATCAIRRSRTPGHTFTHLSYVLTAGIAGTGDAAGETGQVLAVFTGGLAAQRVDRPD